MLGQSSPGRTVVARMGRRGYDVPEGGEREPQKEEKLEDEVEGEPVDDLDEALNHGEERENDPILRRG